MYHALNVRVINLNLYQNVRDVMRWKFRNVHHDILNKKRIPNGELKVLS